MMQNRKFDRFTCKKIHHFAYKTPRVERKASAKQGIIYAAKTAKSKIKSGTTHRQCHSLQRP